MNVSDVRYFTETKDVTPAGLDSSSGDHECSALTVKSVWDKATGQPAESHDSHLSARLKCIQSFTLQLLHCDVLLSSLVFITQIS